MLRTLLPLFASLALTACDKPQATPDSPANDAKSGAASADAPAKATPPPAANEAGDGSHHAADAPAATATIGKPAPDFTLTDLDGKTHTLAEYRGKLVVLEWFNPECPFVNFAHQKGPLQTMAASQAGQGVVWLAINSGGEGRQGFGEQVNRQGVEKFSLGHPVLIDADGAIGHTYGAVKTPHMFLIDTKGTLVYAGAIDNAPFGEVGDGAEPRNHLAAALADIRSDAPVATPQTPAYGCTVKYAKG